MIYTLVIRQELLFWRSEFGAFPTARSRESKNSSLYKHLYLRLSRGGLRGHEMAGPVGVSPGGYFHIFMEGGNLTKVDTEKGVQG